MAYERRRGRIEQDGGQAGTGEMSAALRMEHLRRSFAKFRREHRPGTRIPHALRDEAFGALQCGMRELDVRRACRISVVQLEQWRRRQRLGVHACNGDGQKARVFPVVDEVTGTTIERAGDHAAENLELRIGRWAVCVRQVER